MRILNPIWKFHPSEWLAGRRLTWLLCLLLAAGLLRVYLPVWRSHSAMVVADPYTYIGYARTLAKGRFTLDNALATLAAERAEPGRDDSGAGAMGPVWNTAIRPDGSTIYTVEIAYPFLLSLAVRAGGVPFAVYSNFLLWPLLLTLMFLLVRRGYGAGPASLAAAITVCLLFPAFDHPTFRQMHYPWREPFFMCLLTGGLLLVLSYTQGRGARLLPFAALLFGLACSAKIANGVYLPVIAVFVLASKAFRAQSGKARLLVVGALAFLAGLAPFFIQNLLSTGHPLRSLQVLRETSEYSATEIGRGLSFGNIGMTTGRYLDNVYADALLLRWPFVLLALSALWLLRRRPVVWLVAGLLAAHLALYLQWGNADNRHMVFGSLLYCLLAGMAGVALLERRRWTVVLPVALALAVPLAKVPSARVRNAFGVGDALRLADRLKSEIKAPAVILSNRQLRDVLGVYSGLDVFAYHEMLALDGREHGAPLLRRLMDRGWRAYFLDNEDRDPKHYGGRGAALVDFARADETLLREHFTLTPRTRLAVADYDLDAFDDRREITLYQVEPWAEGAVERTLEVPPGGSSFLFLDGRSAFPRMNVTVNGSPVDLSPHARRHYLPLQVGGTSAVVRVAAPGPLPPLEDMRLVGWDERLLLDLGYDAPHFDHGYFEPSIENAARIDHRRVTEPFTITLPVRAPAGGFGVLSLGIQLSPDVPPKTKEKDPLESLFVQLEDGGDRHLHGLNGRFVLAVPAAGPYSGYVRLRVPPKPGYQSKCERFISSTAWLERRVDARGAHGLAVVGKLYPARDARAPSTRVTAFAQHRYTARAGATVLKEGTCLEDPYLTSNIFSAFVGPDSAEDGGWNLRFEGAALMDMQFAIIGERLAFDWDGPVSGCAISGFYPPERDGAGVRRAWTEQRAEVRVPVSPGVASYALRLVLRNGTPLDSRSVRVRFQGVTKLIQLGPDRGETEQEITFPAPDKVSRPGCADLVLECEPWNPARAGKSSDDRDLGVQLYRFTWAPASP